MRILKKGLLFVGLVVGLVGPSAAELMDKRTKLSPAVKTQNESEKLQGLDFKTDGSSKHGVPVMLPTPVFFKVDTPLILESLHGFGDAIPVEVALKQILPEMQLVDDHAMKGVLVSWSSTSTRKDGLLSLKSFNNDLSVVVDGNLNRVYLMERTAGKQFAALVEEKVWRVAVSDARLDRSLARWAKEAGYSFRWDADRHVLVSASSEFRGSIEVAVNDLLSTPGIRGSEYPLEACIYSNSPPLLRVTRLGDQTNLCR